MEAGGGGLCPSVRRLLYCGRESDGAVFDGDVTSEYRLSQVSLKETPLAGALCGPEATFKCGQKLQIVRCRTCLERLIVR